MIALAAAGLLFAVTAPVGHAQSGHLSDLSGATQVPDFPESGGYLPTWPGSARPSVPGEPLLAEPLAGTPGVGEEFSAFGGGIGADAGFGCPDRWYAMAESYALTREDGDNFTLSNVSLMDDFDFEWGGRFTLGRTYDCLDGWELTYTGPFRWEEFGAVTAPNALTARFLPGNRLTLADLSTFYGADAQSERYTSDLHMFEYNRRWWGWDVFSVKLGSRYINLEDGYEFLSLSDGNLGQMVVEGNNHIGLAQLGIDMMSPIGRWTFGAKLTGGLGINFNDGNFVVVNDGAPIVALGDSSEEFAWMFEGGMYAIYRLSNRISLHAGYDAFYLWGLNVPSDQDYRFVNFDSGSAFDEKGDLLFHGATAGIEFTW